MSWTIQEKQGEEWFPVDSAWTLRGARAKAENRLRVYPGSQMQIVQSNAGDDMRALCKPFATFCMLFSFFGFLGLVPLAITVFIVGWISEPLGNYLEWLLKSVIFLWVISVPITVIAFVRQGSLAMAFGVCVLTLVVDRFLSLPSDWFPYSEAWWLGGAWVIILTMILAAMAIFGAKPNSKT